MDVAFMVNGEARRVDATEAASPVRCSATMAGSSTAVRIRDMPPGRERIVAALLGA